jgi:hypothetical protein
MVNRDAAFLVRLTEKEHDQLRGRAYSEYIRKKLGFEGTNRGGARIGAGRPPMVR